MCIRTRLLLTHSDSSCRLPSPPPLPSLPPPPPVSSGLPEPPSSSSSSSSSLSLLSPLDAVTSSSISRSRPKSCVTRPNSPPEVGVPGVWLLPTLRPLTPPLPSRMVPMSSLSVSKAVGIRIALLCYNGFF